MPFNRARKVQRYYKVKKQVQQQMKENKLGMGSPEGRFLRELDERIAKYK